MNLQAEIGKFSACKIKEHRPIPLAPHVGGNASGGGSKRREYDASG